MYDPRAARRGDPIEPAGSPRAEPNEEGFTRARPTADLGADQLGALDQIAGPRASRRGPEAAQWHLDRARRIVHDHPEVKSLVGPEPRLAVAMVAVGAAHVGLGLAMAWVPLWAAILVAWVFGTVSAHWLG